MNINKDMLVLEMNRSKIDTKDFGIPSLRKYPIHDVKHVILAVKMFSRCDDEHKEELARNIEKKANEFDCWDQIPVTKTNVFWKYCKHKPTVVEESTEMVNEDNNWVYSYNNPKHNNIHPIFIVTTYTHTMFGKMIRQVQGDMYTHACIALDSDLEKMYTFNADSTIKSGGGLSIEDIRDYDEDYDKALMALSVFFVNDRDYAIIKRKIDYYLLYYKETNYYTKDLIYNLTGKSIKNGDDKKMICSQFVDSFLKLLEEDVTMKTSNLVTPQNLARVNNSKIYHIYEGLVKDYDHHKIDRYIKFLVDRRKVSLIREGFGEVKAELFYEAREFPIQFNDDGDLLIHKKENINFLSEYDKSKRLRKEYTKYDNLEGMKYEVCKLWYMNTILEGLIEKYPGKNATYIELRSKILTEYSLYLTEINRRDSEFNFTTYYDETPFNKSKVRIKGSTLKHGTALFKQMLL